MTRKERKLVSVAGIIFAIFLLAKVIPSVRNFFQKQEQAIEEIKTKKQRFEKLERRADFWEEEYKKLRKSHRKIYKASLPGDTPELISANIQSILKKEARNAGIHFKSMELGESAIVGEWVLVTQAMRFEATSETFFNFLNALSRTKSELIVTDLDIRSQRNGIMGKIKVSGFSRPPLKEVKPEPEEVPPPEEKNEETAKEPDKLEVIDTVEGEIPDNSNNVEGQELPIESEMTTEQIPPPPDMPELIDKSSEDINVQPSEDSNAQP